MQRPLPWAFLFTTVISCLFATHTAGASAPHPMDALDASEIVAAVALLRGAGHADKATLFSSITLREPRKETVLAWRKGMPIPRAANVVLRKGSKTYEAVVDLGRREVASFREVSWRSPHSRVAGSYCGYRSGTRRLPYAGGSSEARHCRLRAALLFPSNGWKLRARG